MMTLAVDLERLPLPGFWPDCCARCGASGTTLVPVPTRYTKKIEGLAIPLCAEHERDWTRTGQRNRIGMVVVLALTALVASLPWVLLLPGDADRLALSLFGGAAVCLVIGIPLGFWAKRPIQVEERRVRLAVLSGVCREFVAACGSSVSSKPLPPADPDANFAVVPYQPTPQCTPKAARLLLGYSVAVGAAFGVAVGFLGVQLGKLLLGWDKRDPRHLALVALVVASYIAPMISRRFLFSSFGVMILVGLTGLAVGLAALGWVTGLPPQMSFGIAFGGLPLLYLLMYVIEPLIRNGRVRVGWVAACAGLLGPLVLTGTVYLLGQGASGPHETTYALGPMAGLIFAWYAYQRARDPYCEECGFWLEPRALGALARTRAEAEAVLREGAIVRFAADTVREKADIGDVELKAHTCSECGSAGPVVLELYECQQHKNSSRRIYVGRWLYPGAALPVLDRLFPPSADSPHPTKPP